MVAPSSVVKTHPERLSVMTDAVTIQQTAYVLVPVGRHVSEEFLKILRERYQVSKILLLVQQGEHEEIASVSYVYHSFTDEHLGRSGLFLVARALVSTCSAIASPDIVVLDGQDDFSKAFELIVSSVYSVSVLRPLYEGNTFIDMIPYTQGEAS